MRSLWTSSIDRGPPSFSVLIGLTGLYLSRIAIALRDDIILAAGRGVEIRAPSCSGAAIGGITVFIFPEESLRSLACSPPAHNLSIGGGSVKLSSNLDIMDVIFASMAEKNLKGRPKNARSGGGFFGEGRWAHQGMRHCFTGGEPEGGGVFLPDSSCQGGSHY